MSFDPNKHMIKTRGGKEYLPVAARLVWFRMEHPDWGIVTEPHTIDMEKQFAIYRATIMDSGGKIIATATKQETVKDFPDFLEKSETGAVGRALAMCGYGTQFAPDFAEVSESGGGRVVDAPQDARTESSPVASFPATAKGFQAAAFAQHGIKFANANQMALAANICAGRFEDERTPITAELWKAAIDALPQHAADLAQQG